MAEAKRSRQLLLPDGRRLAFVEYGASAGPLVVYLHGTMGSGVEAVLGHEVCVRLGLRLVGVDRPGHGESTDDRPRTFARFARDIAALADHLDAAQFGLVGWSGGGAHAAAIASVLGARVSRLALVCPAAPLDVRGVQAERSVGPRLAIGLVRFTTLHLWLLAAVLRWCVRRWGAGFFLKVRRGTRVPGDVRALSDAAFREALAASWTRGSMNGAGPIARDVALQLRRWDVAPADPGCPVDLWFGRHDGTAPPATSRFYEGISADVRTTVFEDDGHLLPGTHAEAVFSKFAST